MKFGKHIEAEIVSEWRIKYIDYKSLKRRLKDVQSEKLARERELIHNAHKNKKEIDSNRNSVFVEVPPQSLHNLRLYNENNETRFPNNHGKRLSANNGKRFSMNNDRTFSLQSRTYSLADSVNDFLHKVSSALALQKHQDHDRVPTPVPITSLETLKDEVDPEERAFFKLLDGELIKVDKFYKLKEKESLNQFDLLIQQYEILKNMNGEKKKFVTDKLRQSLDYLKSSSSDRQSSIDYKTAKKYIKKALFELYRGVELVRNYQILNHTGFIKILKKYDKISGRNGSELYKSELEKRHFVNSDEISKLLNKIEDFYMKNLEGVSRNQAIRKLRVPNNRSKTYYSSVLRVGLFLGMALPALIYPMYLLLKAWNMKHDIYLIWNLQIFAGLAIPVLLLLLMGVNFYVWTQLHINYKFIFELNPRDNLDYRQYLELPSVVLLGLSYIMLIYSYNHETMIYPKIFVLFIGVVLFNPFPVFYYNSRRWFIFTLIRLLGSGLLRVEFRDFFFADELNSLAYSFIILQLFGCNLHDQKSQETLVCYSKLKSTILTGSLGSIPAFMRLFQCWKRYRDTYQINHMINIGKYGSSIVSTWSGVIYRTDYVFNGHYGSTFRWIWVITQLFSSIYAFTWDVKIDWALFQPDSINWLLRNKLGCKYNWIYYYAIISNFVLRCSWILIAIYPAEQPYSSMSIFIVAFGEMVRRWQWNFIRIENEHVSNCGHFRAIKDIHLPFPLQTDNDIIAPDNASVDDFDKDFGDSTKSNNSITTISKRLFKKRKPRRNSAQSSNDWKDFESRQDSIEYNMYADIYEESEESDKGENNVEDYEGYGSYGTDTYANTYTSIYTNYASRRLPPIIDVDEKGKQSDSSLSV